MERAADDNNISPELKERLREQEQDVAVWPENWPAVQVWVRAQTQWRMGMGGVTGMDYSGVEMVMRQMKIEDAPDCFGRIQVLEAATLKIIEDRRDA
jgi:hypothetical protein